MNRLELLKCLYLFIQKFSLVFGRFKDTKRKFWNYLTFSQYLSHIGVELFLEEHISISACMKKTFVQEKCRCMKFKRFHHIVSAYTYSTLPAKVPLFEKPSLHKSKAAPPPFRKKKNIKIGTTFLSIFSILAHKKSNQICLYAKNYRDSATGDNGL